MIIDKLQEEFEDIPVTLDGEVLLDRPAAGGFITCPQEVAYMFSIATPEQAVRAGHNLYDYTTLDKAACNKPVIENVATQYIEYSQESLNSLDIPEPAKAGFQNRIDGLLAAMNAVGLDDGLRVALQLPIDIGNA